jgi:hypothetical protein
MKRVSISFVGTARRFCTARVRTRAISDGVETCGAQGLNASSTRHWFVTATLIPSARKNIQPRRIQVEYMYLNTAPTFELVHILKPFLHSSHHGMRRNLESAHMRRTEADASWDSITGQHLVIALGHRHQHKCLFHLFLPDPVSTHSASRLVSLSTTGTQCRRGQSKHIRRLVHSGDMFNHQADIFPFHFIFRISCCNTRRSSSKMKTSTAWVVANWGTSISRCCS